MLRACFSSAWSRLSSGWLPWWGLTCVAAHRPPQYSLDWVSSVVCEGNVEYLAWMFWSSESRLAVLFAFLLVDLGCGYFQVTKEKGSFFFLNSAKDALWVAGKRELRFQPAILADDRACGEKLPTGYPLVPPKLGWSLYSDSLLRACLLVQWICVWTWVPYLVIASREAHVNLLNCFLICKRAGI